MSDPFDNELPTLTTTRGHLRHPRRSDADALFAIYGDPIAMRYWSCGPYTERQQAVDLLAAIDDGFLGRSLFEWVIATPDDRVIGTVTLYAWSRNNRRAELGYMLARPMWGSGYAAEAVRAVLGFAFSEMDLHRIEADVHPDNTASVRLLERLGFVREGLLADRWFTHGQWSDSALYGLLRERWPAKSTTRP